MSKRRQNSTRLKPKLSTVLIDYIIKIHTSVDGFCQKVMKPRSSHFQAKNFRSEDSDILSKCLNPGWIHGYLSPHSRNLINAPLRQFLQHHWRVRRHDSNTIPILQKIGESSYKRR
ncbi:hypothetical protein SMJ63A_10381 [Stenotrophomonas geniculata]